MLQCDNEPIILNMRDYYFDSLITTFSLCVEVRLFNKNELI